MPLASKIVLHALDLDSPLLRDFVEECVRDSVKLICVVGADCELVEDAIDELIVADGFQPHRFIVTTSHKHETLDEVLDFANTWPGVEGPAQQVRL